MLWISLKSVQMFSCESLADGHSYFRIHNISMNKNFGNNYYWTASLLSLNIVLRQSKVNAGIKHLL